MEGSKRTLYASSLRITGYRKGELVSLGHHCHMLAQCEGDLEADGPLRWDSFGATAVYASPFQQGKYFKRPSPIESQVIGCKIPSCSPGDKSLPCARGWMNVAKEETCASIVTSRIQAERCRLRAARTEGNTCCPATGDV